MRFSIINGSKQARGDINNAGAQIVAAACLGHVTNLQAEWGPRERRAGIGLASSKLSGAAHYCDY